MDVMVKHLKKKEIAAYSLGLFGFQAIVGFLNSYQAEFYAATMAADLALVGVLLLVVRVVSAAFDPVVGNLIERKNSKRGKLKPFIMFSIIPLAVMTVLIFTEIPLKGPALYGYIFITYLMWSLAMTLGDVPSQAIASVLTPNPTERTSVVSIANTLKSVGFAAAYVVVPIACLLVPGGSRVFGYEGGKDTPINSTEYFASSVIIGVLGCLLFSLIVFYSKERVGYKTQRMSYSDMWRTLRDNKPLMMVIVSYFLGFGRQMAMGIQIQAANVLLGGQNLIVVLGITTAVGSMISMIITPLLIKKIGEKNTFLLLSIYGFVISMITFFIGTENKILMFSFLFLIGLQFGAVTLLPMIMAADCVDYYELKTGKRTEGTVYAVLSLTIKICLAMGTALGLLLLKASKYNAQDIVFAEETKKLVYFGYTALPGIFSLLAAVPMLKYGIVGNKKLEIAMLLQERRELATKSDK